MFKNIGKTLSIILLISLILTGCGSGDPSTKAGDVTEQHSFERTRGFFWPALNAVTSIVVIKSLVDPPSLGSSCTSMVIRNDRKKAQIDALKKKFDELLRMLDACPAFVNSPEAMAKVGEYEGAIAQGMEACSDQREACTIVYINSPFGPVPAMCYASEQNALMDKQNQLLGALTTAVRTLQGFLNAACNGSQSGTIAPPVTTGDFAPLAELESTNSD